MRACAVYATYVVAGNDGALRESGVAKLKELFAQDLDVIQKAKLRQAGVEPDILISSQFSRPIEGFSANAS